MIVRWWRWLTNPRPCPGQYWAVDGIGRVKIAYRHDGDIVFTCADGETLAWNRDQFASQAVVWRPRAAELFDAGVPDDG